MTGLPPAHAPAWHVSVCVHRLPSSHCVPSAATGLLHVPVVVLQVPAEWQASLAAQTVEVPVQVPETQASCDVQALPSLHEVPSVAVGLEQVPVATSQVPATWHASVAAHVFGFDQAQKPAWQVSVCVQPLLSLQAVPFGATGFEHDPEA